MHRSTSLLPTPLPSHHFLPLFLPSVRPLLRSVLCSGTCRSSDRKGKPPFSPGFCWRVPDQDTGIPNSEVADFAMPSIGIRNSRHGGNVRGKSDISTKFQADCCSMMARRGTLTLGLAIAASLCIVTFLAIASSQSRTGPLQVGIRNIRCQSRSADRFSLGTINKPKFYVARKSHFRPGFIARAGIEALDNGVMEGFELKPIEESAVEQAEVRYHSLIAPGIPAPQTLAEWYLEIQMNDSFDIDDGFTEEAKSFTKAFKARLNGCLVKETPTKD
eukprot:jgi/Bigna1/71517/fgenesh1_pg.16_\